MPHAPLSPVLIGSTLAPPLPPLPLLVHFQDVMSPSTWSTTLAPLSLSLLCHHIPLLPLVCSHDVTLPSTYPTTSGQASLSHPSLITITLCSSYLRSHLVSSLLLLVVATCATSSPRFLPLLSHNMCHSSLVGATSKLRSLGHHTCRPFRLE
jgi:hypothetical protein